MHDYEAVGRDALAQIDAAADLPALEAVRVSLLGKSGSISALMKTLGSMDPAERNTVAPRIQGLRQGVAEAIEARKSRGEHSLEGDRVALKVCRDERQLVIDVNDTGVGLPHDRERLTEPYMTTRVRGTGLGLAIVKKIVEEHGGEIAFLDRSGGGTHVRIAFDLARLALLAEAADKTQDEESA